MIDNIPEVSMAPATCFTCENGDRPLKSNLVCSKCLRGIKRSYKKTSTKKIQKAIAIHEYWEKNYNKEKIS